MNRIPLVIFLIALLSVASHSFAQSEASAISNSRQVIENQLSAFGQQSHEEAFSYAAPGLRQVFRDVNNFIAMVKRGYRPIYLARSWSYGRNRVASQTVVHHEVLISGPDGNQWKALYTLMRQNDGSWKISGVQLRKSSASAI